jgi:hypothetical protein
MTAKRENVDICGLHGPYRLGRLFTIGTLLCAVCTGVAQATVYGSMNIYEMSNPSTLTIAEAGPLLDSQLSIGAFSQYEVDYGTIRVFTSANIDAVANPELYGGAGATAVAGFGDEILITAPNSALEFQPGTLRARVDLSGVMGALGIGYSRYIFGVGLYPQGRYTYNGTNYSYSGGDYIFQHRLIGTATDPDWHYAGTSFEGDGFGSYEFDLPFYFNTPTVLSMELIVLAMAPLGYAEKSDIVPASAIADLSNTARWGGVLGLFDGAGNPLSEFQITSASGYDYATLQPAAVPLPASAWLLLSGIALLGGCLRKRV